MTSNDLFPGGTLKVPNTPAIPKEVRMTDPETGGQKGAKLQRYDLIPVGPLRYLAELYGFGCQKYDANNWRRGYDWSLSYAGLQRHVNQFWNTDESDWDEESGVPHLINAAWHCFTLTEFMSINQKKDDRWKGAVLL